MNYLKKCVVSAIEADIYNSNSYDLGVIIGDRIKFLELGNVEGCDGKAFLEGVEKGFQKALIREATRNSDECN